MRDLKSYLAEYSSFHQDEKNKALHFIGVPMIVFGIMVALQWLHLPGLGLSLTRMVLVPILIFYLLLDLRLGLVLTVVFILLDLLAENTIGQLIFSRQIMVFLFFFFGGWTIQLLGHSIEGKKPALFKNLLHILIAPVFLAVETAFFLGWRRDLKTPS